MKTDNVLIIGVTVVILSLLFRGPFERVAVNLSQKEVVIGAPQVEALKERVTDLERDNEWLWECIQQVRSGSEFPCTRPTKELLL